LTKDRGKTSDLRSIVERPDEKNKNNWRSGRDTCRQEGHFAVVERCKTFLYVPQHALAVVLVLERRTERQSTDHHRVHHNATVRRNRQPDDSPPTQSTTTLHATASRYATCCFSISPTGSQFIVYNCTI